MILFTLPGRVHRYSRLTEKETEARKCNQAVSTICDSVEWTPFRVSGTSCVSPLTREPLIWSPPPTVLSW